MSCLNWRGAILFLVLVSCNFKSMQDSADSTLYAGDLILNVHSSDLSLNNRLQSEFKAIAKPVLKKPYRVDIQLNPEASPVVYDQCGAEKRWYSSVTADLMIADKSNVTVSHKQIKVRCSFDPQGHAATEEADDVLMKDLAGQIANIITRLP